ncbi:hypothetical protein [Ferruginivarius sediminum]|uniref:Uncharacterized protein n=1 Tax=Ferruginivarius sediminum TaxID=2661937 RepID=A0A369THI2_9PROT|nr:hypothetical protein [Ferruginivarius sediminum]RDD62366.1 hypothetical protein DRB17_09085 [Ferruginivarius sediminum]
MICMLEEIDARVLLRRGGTPSSARLQAVEVCLRRPVGELRLDVSPNTAPCVGDLDVPATVGWLQSVVRDTLAAHGIPAEEETLRLNISAVLEGRETAAGWFVLGDGNGGGFA